MSRREKQTKNVDGNNAMKSKLSKQNIWIKIILFKYFSVPWLASYVTQGFFSLAKFSLEYLDAVHETMSI